MPSTIDSIGIVALVSTFYAHSGYSESFGDALLVSVIPEDSSRSMLQSHFPGAGIVLGSANIRGTANVIITDVVVVVIVISVVIVVALIVNHRTMAMLFTIF